MRLSALSDTSRDGGLARARGLRSLVNDLEALSLRDEDDPGAGLDYRRAYWRDSEERFRRQKARDMDMMLEHGSCCLLFSIGRAQDIIYF